MPGLLLYIDRWKGFCNISSEILFVKLYYVYYYIKYAEYAGLI